MEKCVKRQDKFSQVVVWPGAKLTDDGGPYSAETVADFVEWFAKADFRIQYLEEIVTGPGQGGPGGRHDQFFAIHEDDIDRFAPWRFQYGLRWLEDIFFNHQTAIYPRRIKNYRTW